MFFQKFMRSRIIGGGLSCVLDKIEKLKTQPNDELAENALMYSILIQNFVLNI